MILNKHFDLTGRHAFLSASKSHWVNYDNEKFDQVFRTAMLAQRGTDLHNLAAEAIRLGVKFPRTSTTLNMYVNDAIGYRMSPEQILAYSENSFGTADALSFRNNFLRIHDLKTGTTKTTMRQLEVYVALFCLEYRVKPSEIEIELRIYQNDNVLAHVPDLDDIIHIMDKIVTFDKRIKQIKEEVQS